LCLAFGRAGLIPAVCPVGSNASRDIY